jgi:putative transposase
MAYLSVILDLYNGEVVAYKTSLSQDASLSIDVIRDLIDKRTVKDALIHSDQGIHYTNKKYHELLKGNGIIQSMSRKGNCWDNAMVENFFSHFKVECVRIRKRAFRSFLDVAEAVEEYIQYYNNERPQKKLNGFSPVKYRQLNSNF